MSRTQTTIDPEALKIPAGHAWNRIPMIGGIVGVVFIAVSFALRGGQPEQFYFSWLTSFMFFLSLALGAMFFVLTHWVTRASWSVVLRRMAEHIMGTLPLFALLFIPIVLGMHDLFHWTDVDAVEHDPLLQAKSGYLNTPFFLARAAFCFLCWVALALWFKRRSVNQDSSGDVATTLRLIQLSAPALFVYALTVTIAAVDWVMTLDPHWYSTMFGVYYFAGSLVGIFAFMSLLAVAMRRAGLLGGTVTLEHLHDLGKLLFAFTVFWAYIAFSQYFLIWYANIPEETVFYSHRAEGSWLAVSQMLMWGHFGVPFLFLMSRKIKRKAGLLVLGSIWMLVMHFMDLHWLIMPVLHPHHVDFSLLDLTTLLGIGGLFVALVECGCFSLYSSHCSCSTLAPQPTRSTGPTRPRSRASASCCWRSQERSRSSWRALAGPSCGSSP